MISNILNVCLINGYYIIKNGIKSILNVCLIKYYIIKNEFKLILNDQYQDLILAEYYL